jgi:anti-anti-sigma factor
MRFKAQEENGILHCEGSLDIRAVDELRTQILSYIEEHDGIRLDLSRVSACDTAGVQLLHAAGMQAAVNRKLFTIQDLSDAVRQTVSALGLSTGYLSGENANV